jgi:hypothetical protein
VTGVFLRIGASLRVWVAILLTIAAIWIDVP